MTAEYVAVSSKLGKLKGLVKKSAGISNKTYCSFQGIPYAKPPIGKLRFKAPKAFGKWEGVLDATKEGNDCAQKHMVFKHVIGNEDCLYLNVYTPQKPGTETSKKPVMVWIHGFLSLDNDKVPGNAGMKDQNLALRWVQDNIDSFGGDPNNVTIFGESGGAGSVNHHILSPLSKGLFHKAIMQSGSSLCQWGVQTNSKEKALLLAKELGCTSQDPDKVLEFLMDVPAQEIVEAQHKPSLVSHKENIQRSHTVFTPCVESAGDEPFLSDYPHKLMERGAFNKVPVIIGVTDKEGVVIAALKGINFDAINDDPTIVVPFNLKIQRNSEEERKLGKEILQFYTNKEVLSWDVIHGYVDLISDVGFVLGMEGSRQCFLKHSNYPVYTYLFTYTSPRALSSLMIPANYPDHAAELLQSGSSHGDEMVHLFKTNFSQAPSIPPTDEDQVFMNKFLKAWTNFAKTGDPNHEDIGATWKPDDVKSPHFLELGKVCQSADGTMFPKRMEF